MKNRNIKKILITLLALAVIYWLPFLAVASGAKIDTFDTLESLPKAEAVIVFGAHITKDREVTPILKERLEAGRVILEAGKAEKIIVSNTEAAAYVMAEYLEEQGVPSEAIEFDVQAVTTIDTCKYEAIRHPEKREVIFVSQGFHLPRILYQCEKVGVEGAAFAAESLDAIGRPKYSFFTKVSTRTSRYTREAALVWLAVLGIYE